MRKKDNIDYLVGDFTTALMTLPLHIEDYNRPEDEIRTIFNDVFPLSVLEAMKEAEID